MPKVLACQNARSNLKKYSFSGYVQSSDPVTKDKLSCIKLGEKGQTKRTKTKTSPLVKIFKEEVKRGTKMHKLCIIYA